MKTSVTTFICFERKVHILVEVTVNLSLLLYNSKQSFPLIVWL